MPHDSPAPPVQHVLPPLILHPFTDSATSLKLLESAKAAAQMMSDVREWQTQAEQLRERLLEGRYAELRMLFFVGKDVFRWLNQCVDFSERSESLRGRGFAEQSFSEFLILETPPQVDAKLRRWGVTDYARIFTRSIGIRAQFHEPPPRRLLSAEYLRTYHRFADYSYTCWKDSLQFAIASSDEFAFSLYASGEYSKLLEEQWSGQ